MFTTEVPDEFSLASWVFQQFVSATGQWLSSPCLAFNSANCRFLVKLDLLCQQLYYSGALTRV